MKNIKLSHIRPTVGLQGEWRRSLPSPRDGGVTREQEMANLGCKYGAEQGALAALEAVIEYLERDPYCHTMAATGVPQQLRQYFLPEPAPIEKLEESLKKLKQIHFQSSPPQVDITILMDIENAIQKLKENQ
jgi:hypothetical protein